MTCKVMHQTCYGIYWIIIIEIGPKKINFLARFEAFVYSLWYSMSYIPRFFQIKDLITIYIRGQFDQYRIFGSEVRNFQSFLYRLSIHEMTPFCIFWTVTPQKIVQFCWNINQRLSPTRQILLQKSFKIMNFRSDGTYHKFTVSVHFGAQYTAGKPNILLKTKISAKATSLGIWNSASSWSKKITEFLWN